MSESLFLCCLCKLVPLPIDHRRTKKHFSCGFAVARDVLRVIGKASHRQPPTFSIDVLCSCEKSLLNVRKCGRKLQSLKDEELNKLTSPLYHVYLYVTSLKTATLIKYLASYQICWQCRTSHYAQFDQSIFLGK